MHKYFLTWTFRNIGALADALLNFSWTRPYISRLGLEPSTSSSRTLRAAVRTALTPRSPRRPRAKSSRRSKGRTVVPVASLRSPGSAPVKRLVALCAGVQTWLQISGYPGSWTAVVPIDPGAVAAGCFVAPGVGESPGFALVRAGFPVGRQTETVWAWNIIYGVQTFFRAYLCRN
jgi:hypothetical protein